MGHEKAQAQNVKQRNGFMKKILELKNDEQLLELGVGCLHVSSIPNAMLGFFFFLHQ